MSAISERRPSAGRLSLNQAALEPRSLREAVDVCARQGIGAIGLWRHKVHEARAAGRIAGFHVSDWIVPLPDVLTGRGLMGDGVIALGAMREAVDAAGYDGPIEVEILNEALWAMDPDTLVRLVKERFLACC